MLTDGSGFQQESSRMEGTQTMVVVCSVGSAGGIIMKTVMISCLISYLMISLASSQMHKEVPVTCKATLATDGESGTILCDYNLNLSSLTHLHLVVEFYPGSSDGYVKGAECEDGYDSCRTFFPSNSFVRGEGESEMVLHLNLLPWDLSGRYVCTLRDAQYIGASRPCSLQNNCQLMKPLRAVEEAKYLQKPDDLTRNNSCTWLITSSTRIMLRVVYIDTVRNVDNLCHGQHLSVYDGPNETSPVLLDLCDNTLKEGSAVVSYSNHSFVKFTPSWPAKVRDFKLQYQTFTGFHFLPVTCQASVATDGGSASILCDYNLTLSSVQDLHLGVNFHKDNWQAFDTDAVQVAQCNNGPGSCYSNVSGYSFVKGEKENEMVLNIAPVPGDRVGGYVCTMRVAQYIKHSPSCSLEDSCQLMKPLRAVEAARYLRIPKELARSTRNRTCTWLITSASVIKLTVVYVYVQWNLGNICQGQHLSVYDGPDESSPVLMDLCDNTLKEDTAVVSYSNRLFVKLSHTRPAKIRSFKLQYQALTQIEPLWEYNKTIHLASDEMRDISSLYYPFYYPRKANFFWLVKVPENHKVQLDVVNFDLQGGSCHESYVIIYDGSSKYSSRIVMLCKEGGSTRYVSTKQTMYITFRSGDKRSTGFKFQLSTVPPDKTAAIVGGVIGGVVGLMVLAVILAAIVINVRKSRRSQSASGSGGRDSSRSERGGNVYVMNPVIINHLHPSAPSPPSPTRSRASGDPSRGYRGRSTSAADDLPAVHHRRSSEGRASDDLPPAYRVAVESDLEVAPPPVTAESEAPPPYTDSMLDSHPPCSSGRSGGGARGNSSPAHRPVSQGEATQRSSLQTSRNSDVGYLQPRVADLRPSAPQQTQRQQPPHRQPPPPHRQSPLRQQPPPPLQSGPNPTPPYRQPSRQQPRAQRNSEDEAGPSYRSPHYPPHSRPLVRPAQQQGRLAPPVFPTGLPDSEPTTQQQGRLAPPAYPRALPDRDSPEEAVLLHGDSQDTGNDAEDDMGETIV